MTNLSYEAMNYLRALLSAEVHRQVENGEGDQPMSPGWTELYLLTVDL